VGARSSPQHIYPTYRYRPQPTGQNLINDRSFQPGTIDTFAGPAWPHLRIHYCLGRISGSWPGSPRSSSTSAHGPGRGRSTKRHRRVRNIRTSRQPGGGDTHHTRAVRPTTLEPLIIRVRTATVDGRWGAVEVARAHLSRADATRFSHAPPSREKVPCGLRQQQRDAGALVPAWQVSPATTCPLQESRHGYSGGGATVR
jgi:hypothetical protein